MPLPPACTFMSIAPTCCTHANSIGQPGQANMPFSSSLTTNATMQNNTTTTPQTIIVTPTTSFKPLSQMIKYKVPLLNDNGDNYTH